MEFVSDRSDPNDPKTIDRERNIVFKIHRTSALRGRESSNFEFTLSTDSDLGPFSPRKFTISEDAIISPASALIGGEYK